MKIFTTINPYNNLDSQEEAISSWTKMYNVYSVNTKKEIEVAKNRFLNINFIETEDVFTYKKKNLIKLNAILNAIKSIDGDLFAIVNSDIILKMELPITDIDFDLLMVTRWELEDSKDTYPFINGYDLFIFNKKHLDIFVNSNYVIGMPWWDFWMPLVAIKNDLKLVHIQSPIIYHRTHETRYDVDIWIHFGEYLYKDIVSWSNRYLIVINSFKRPDNPVGANVYDFCSSVKNYIETRQINITL